MRMVLSNATVQRLHATLTSAAHVHNDMTHLRQRRRITVRCNCLLGGIALGSGPMQGTKNSEDDF
jgi:hypothetical protein